MKICEQYVHVCRNVWQACSHFLVSGNFQVARNYQRRWTWTGDFKCREVKTGFCRKRWTQTGSSGTLIGWKSGQTTFIPLWDRMEGAWLWSQEEDSCRGGSATGLRVDRCAQRGDSVQNQNHICHSANCHWRTACVDVNLAIIPWLPGEKNDWTLLCFLK